MQENSLGVQPKKKKFLKQENIFCELILLLFCKQTFKVEKCGKEKT